MGLRALLGVEDAGGTYRARPVHYDGCPTVIVPALTRLVHDVHEHDQAAAVEHLLQNDWRWLYLLPRGGKGLTGEIVGVRSDESRPAETGEIATARAGDREWAYLFGGHRLHVYLSVAALKPFTGRWVPWACWSVHELPSLSIKELLDVQRQGYSRQWSVSRQMEVERVIQGIGEDW